MNYYISELINKKFSTDKGISYFVDLITEKYPTFKVDEDALKGLSIVEMKYDYFEKTGFNAEYIAEKKELRILQKIKTSNNIIEFTEDEIIEAFLHELIHVLTSKVDMDNEVIFEGINIRRLANKVSSYFLALNEGITQLIVNDLLGVETDAYLFETNIASQLALIVGKDFLIECYSNNDFNKLIDGLKQINSELSEKDFIVSIYYISSVINSMDGDVVSVENGEKVKYIQEELIKMYLSSKRNNDELFEKLIIDRVKANSIINPDILLKAGINRNIDDYGFKNLKNIKQKFIDVVDKEKGSGKMSVDKLGDYMLQGQEAALKMEERIKNGKVIAEAVDEETGEKTIVTITENGTYGYQVFEKYDDEPHYLVEGTYLIEDLNTNTASTGVGLRYPGAKSRIQRNMLGVFLERIKDRGHDSLYISVKAPKDGEIQVSQRMVGYYPEDAVSILGFQFYSGEFSIASDAQIYEEDNGKKKLIVGVGKVSKDGTMDYESSLKMVLEAEMSRRFFGEEPVSREVLEKAVEQATRDAQGIFYDLYYGFNLPILEGVKPIKLNFFQASAYSMLTDSDEQLVNKNYNK